MVLWTTEHPDRRERMDFQIGKSVLIKLDLSPWGIGEGSLIHEAQVVALGPEKVTIRVHDLEIEAPFESVHIRELKL